MEELSEDVIEKIRIKAEVAYLDSIRVNFSQQAEDVYQRIKSGQKPTNLDYFILTTTDQKKIDQAIKFEKVKEKIAKGRIEYKDIDFLIGNLGDVGKFSSVMVESFYTVADNLNLKYAQEHPEEFTNEEIQERIKKVEERRSLNDVLKDDLL